MGIWGRTLIWHLCQREETTTKNYISIIWKSVQSLPNAYIITHERSEKYRMSRANKKSLKNHKVHPMTWYAMSLYQQLVKVLHVLDTTLVVIIVVGDIGRTGKNSGGLVKIFRQRSCGPGNIFCQTSDTDNYPRKILCITHTPEYNAHLWNCPHHQCVFRTLVSSVAFCRLP